MLVLLTIYMLCLFDYPLRRGRHLYQPYEGFKGIVYTFYGVLFFGIAVLTGILFSLNTTHYFTFFNTLGTLLVSVVSFLFFCTITVSVTEKRSRNECFLLRLREKNPFMAD